MELSKLNSFTSNIFVYNISGEEEKKKLFVHKLQYAQGILN